MEIITLQEYTDQYVSLYEGEIRNLPNDLALRLISKGVAAQHDKDILNTTSSDDNGKILTVINGKPAFSTPATPEINMNYGIIYTNNYNEVYSDKIFENKMTLEQFVNLWEDSDFIIVNHYDGYDQYSKTSTDLATGYSLEGTAATINSFYSSIGYIGTSSTGEK